MKNYGKTVKDEQGYGKVQKCVDNSTIPLKNQKNSDHATLLRQIMEKGDNFKRQ